MNIKNKSKYNEAVSIVKKLKENGYESYFVGGYIRDKILGIANKENDIDIVTSCLIQDIPKIFKDVVYVNIAFGTCVVKIKSDNKFFQYDITTLRKDGTYKDGRHPSSIKVQAVSVEEDAKRRDFTINALYYDPLTDKILDFIGGRKDLKNKIIRAVGTPHERLNEDKLRMLRAVRLHHQLYAPWWKGNKFFRIHWETKKAIKKISNELLPSVSYERIWQELDKMNKTSRFADCLQELKELGLLFQFLPEIKKWDHATWDKQKQAVKSLPENSPTLIKLMTLLGTFDSNKVIEITKKFNIKKPNWVETW